MEGNRRSLRLQNKSPPKSPPELPPKKKSRTLKVVSRSPPKVVSRSPPRAVSRSPQRAVSRSPPKVASRSPPKVASTVLPVHYYVHNAHIRPLIAIPINNPDLWPTRAAPFFRSTGTSNEGYGMFTGTWFPFISLKDDTKMPGYLTNRSTGFIIKSGFIYGEDDEISLSPKQKWIHDLVDDFPVTLNESIVTFLGLSKGTDGSRLKGTDGSRLGASAKGTEFPTSDISKLKIVDLHKMLINNKNIENPVYMELVQLLKNTIDYVFCKFLKYFLYPWQVMVSRSFGTGYWQLNQELYHYIGEKLKEHDIINATIPVTDSVCDAKDTEISCAIAFLESHNAQMTLGEIHELEVKERPKQETNSINSIFTYNGKIETYYKKILQLENAYISAKRAIDILNNRTKK